MSYPIGVTSYGGEQMKYDLQNANAIMPSMRQRIAAVQQAEDRLKDVKRAAEILDKNPDLEELLNIMQRSHF